MMPKLNDLCREHLVAITLVDLRLGLKQSNSWQESYLKLALDEADRFVCERDRSSRFSMIVYYGTETVLVCVVGLRYRVA